MLVNYCWLRYRIHGIQIRKIVRENEIDKAELI